MPDTQQDLVLNTDTDRPEFSLEPAMSAVQSIMLLCKYGTMSGFDSWIARTYAEMTQEQRDHNCLVAVGFYHAIMPQRSWPDLPSYVAYLKSIDPVELRDRMMREYAAIHCTASEPVDRAQIDTALASEENYLAFLTRQFGPELVAEEMERTAYSYAVDPPAMRQIIVEHLEQMWSTWLEREWAENLPLLHEELRRVRQLDLRSGENAAILRQLTGHDPDNDWVQERLAMAPRAVFVPHAHLGRYVRVHLQADTVWVFYGPSVPEGIDPHSPLLSRREMLLRAGALADETRLQIVRLISAEGEMRSGDVMERLGLSQSAASRHLTQLVSAGYLAVRKDAGAKSYRVDPESVRTTTEAFRRYLLGL